MLSLIDQFSGYMFRDEREHERPRSGSSDFLLNIFFIICEFIAEQTGNPADFFSVCNNLNMPEDDHAADIQRPFPVPAEALIIYAEGSLVMAADRIDLVSLHTAVEIDLSVIFTVKMIQRHTVRIIIIAQNRKHASWLLPEYFNTFRF